MGWQAAALRAKVGTGALVIVEGPVTLVQEALDGVSGVHWLWCHPGEPPPGDLAERLLAGGGTIVVPDPHLAGPATLALLRRLARAAPSSRLLLVVVADAGAGVPAGLRAVPGVVSLGPADHVAALLVEAAAALREGRPREAAARCVDAADLAVAAGRADLLAEAALLIRGAGDPDVLTRAVLLCDRALTHHTTASPTRARLVARRAALRAEGDQGSPGDGVAALDAARESGDPDALLDAVRARTWHLDGPGDVDERLRLAQLTVDTGLRTGRLLAAVRGELWRVDVAYQRQDRRGVDEGAARLRDLAGTAGTPVARWHALRVDAARAALRGRFAEARAASDAAHAVAGSLGDGLAALVTDVFAGLLALLRGDPGELRDGWRERFDEHPELPLMVAAAALARLQAGEREAALTRYERLRHLLREPPRGVRWLGLQQHLTELALSFADVEAAGWAYRLWLPWVDAGGLPGSADSFCGGAAARPLGRLAALLGRPDEAVALLTRAVEGNVRLEARPWLVHTWHDLAKLGDAAAAGRARVEARRLGMAVPGGAGSDPVAALTARERQVAELVAAALSNRDIAARLGIGERTVESHVRHILTKLDRPNRTALTALLLHRSA